MKLTNSQLEAVIKLSATPEFQDVVAAMTDYRNMYVEFAMFNQNGSEATLAYTAKAASITEVLRAFEGAPKELEKARQRK